MQMTQQSRYGGWQEGPRLVHHENTAIRLSTAQDELQNLNHREQNGKVKDPVIPECELIDENSKTPIFGHSSHTLQQALSTRNTKYKLL